MWLRRSKTKNRIHDASPLKFACSSFKDINALCNNDGGGAATGDTPDSPSTPSIYHRSRSVKELLRSLSITALPRHLPNDEIRISGADKTVVLYLTSLRVIRRTFDDCSSARSILRSFRVPVDERDVSMDSGFMDELQRILGESERSNLALPRVFICGRYLGGAEELRRLHENGELKKYFEGLPPADPGTCEACGGYRFLLCVKCNGSHKCFREKSGFRSCNSCNENGLIRCPSCSM